LGKKTRIFYTSTQPAFNAPFSSVLFSAWVAAVVAATSTALRGNLQAAIPLEGRPSSGKKPITAEKQKPATRWGYHSNYQILVSEYC
jgi:hypothetical protein